MKRVVLLTVLLTAVAATGQQWEGDVLSPGPSLHALVGVTWDSKYIWRGFDYYWDKSATHLTADINLFETGLGISAVAHRANSSGFENRERLDGTVYYQGGLFAGEAYATNFRAGFVYYNFPDLGTHYSEDMEEGQLVLSWPNILPIHGLQPSYVLIHMWPARSDSVLPDDANGWMHIGMLDYRFAIPGIVPEVPEHIITLHGEIVYNDGLTVVREYPNPDHDFSHAVLGVSTDVALSPDNSLVLTPAVYYQITMNDSINDDDDGNNELWVSLGLKYSF